MAQPTDNAQMNDPVFAEEQARLSATYGALQQIGRTTAKALEEAALEAAADKESMADELARNFATADDALETWADFAAMDRIIDGYNLAQTANAEKLKTVELLLKRPYFAKIVVTPKSTGKQRELYIGAAGIAGEDYRRLVVDWRSPVAEVYYNQSEGPTSYKVDGRTIEVELQLRRQFDIGENRLNAYFDTTVAIEDPLLLASLAHERSAHMKAITATIQREQNTVVRHEDVPVLLVRGIAGSGKTSVMMQRIAYLLFQNRSDLKAQDVFLLSPNPLFARYIEDVLPEMGEANPETLTWEQFAQAHLPKGRGAGSPAVPLQRLEAMERAVRQLEFSDGDFCDITLFGTRLIAADQARKVSEKYGHLPAGPHRVALMREELWSKLESRLGSMAASDGIQDEISALSIEEQLRILGELYDPSTEQEAREQALVYVRDRFAEAFDMVERDEWLNIEAIGRRLAGGNIGSLEWLFAKMLVTGLSNPDARFVMVDEVQDYTEAQLLVLATYFRRAHFLLLGDPNQAIDEHTASFDEVKALMGARFGQVSECGLMTSYRSSPEITALFARLAADGARMEISSVRPAVEEVQLVRCETADEQQQALRRAVAAAREAGGLAAVVVPWKSDLKRTAAQLEGEGVLPLTDADTLPAEGVVLLPLKLAKGLEFDSVVVPDVSEAAFPAGEDIARRRLYTTISRATSHLTLISKGAPTGWLGSL
ncbi:HelD family protein [Parvibacter caecicola]|uniref:HelD family protein n=1 Tax=Parvibacter caecicola TaxID=747645 RepID=UPI00249C99CE|nr:ATP-binding domain-containing protein [Parvibacter caecicola]